MNNKARRHKFMRFPRLNLTKASLAALFVIAAAIPALGPSGESSAQGPALPKPTSPSAQYQSLLVRIKNFGEMDENFYRGAQPEEGDYKDLAALGIKAIIDLRDDPTSYEKQSAEALGIRYFNIPMSDKRKPKNEQIAAFWAIADKPENLPFYVHCVGGRHRTGLIGALYRYKKYGWDYDTVYKEMKNYDYYSRWGHGAIKDYVQEYFQSMKLKGIETTTDATPSEPQSAPPLPQPTE
jgi:protein tyrosine/serine phosphatase